MTALLISIALKVWPFIAAAVGFLGWGIYRERKGAAKERAKQAASEAKARDVADEIDDAVAGRSPDENRKELKSW
mgnify:CR=1 FL=1